MKKILILIYILLITLNMYAQDYYYSNNRKIYFIKSDNWIVVQIKEQDLAAFSQMLAQVGTARIRQTLKPERGILWLEIKHGNVLQNVLIQIQRNIGVLRTIPAYYVIDNNNDTARFIMNDEFHVKFNPHVSRTDVELLNAKYGVEILEVNEYNEYLLRATEHTSLTTLELANLYYESDLTIWSLPNFLADIRREQINDPLFSNQWHLQNTGQGGGVPGVDINAVQAWNINTGSSAITIAVIDDGVEMHEDFYSGQLVPGYNPGSRGDPSPRTQDKHGQCVAGISAAKFNNIGVRGVTSDVKIMPIHIFDGDVNDVGITKAIDTAWVRGAHILQNSWGMGSSYYDNIAEAITRALTLGRGGKGCLVVKSAGNTGSYVTFPGTVPGVLVVGAVTNQNNPPSYTPRSDRVDVVAPSGSRLSNFECDYDYVGIWTIDRHTGGYTPCGGQYYGDNTGKYFSHFSGTSAAAPQVSGLGALILSINPNLEARPVGSNPNPQVQNIIRQTATDYGTTNWDGYGRVNAYQAVFAVSSYPTIVSSLPMTSQVTISWNVPSLSWVNGTLVARSTSPITWQPTQALAPGSQTPPTGVTIVYTGNGTSFTNTGLTNGVFYYYKSYTYILNPTTNMYYYSAGREKRTMPILMHSDWNIATAYNAGRKTTYQVVTECPQIESVQSDVEEVGILAAPPPGGCVTTETWHVIFGHESRLYYTYSRNKGTRWYPVQLISGNVTLSSTSNPTLFLDGGGTLHVLFSGWGSTYEELYYQRKPYNSGWFSSPYLLENRWFIKYPSFVVDGSGNAHVSWFSSLAGVHVIFYGTFNTALSCPTMSPYYIRWDNSSTINSPPSISLDEYGTPEIVWSEVGYSTGWAWKVLYSYKTGTASWSTPVSMSGSSTEALFPTISGNTLTWHHVSYGKGEIYSRVREYGYWNPIDNLSNNSGDSRYPTISGNIISWHDNTDGYYKIFYKQVGASGYSTLSSNISGTAAHPNIVLYGSNLFGVWTYGDLSPRAIQTGYQSLLTSKTLFNTERFGESQKKDLPSMFKLGQNFPNPFNPVTRIEYDLPEASYVRIKLYDAIGQEVSLLVNGVQDAGFKAASFDASNLPSGVYLYKLTARTSAGSTFTDVKKMILMK